MQRWLNLACTLLPVLTSFSPDLSLIPVSDLPLQTVLAFQPCPSPIAASYLYGLCMAEGYRPDRDSLVQLYESADDPSGFIIEPTARSPDLRRAIHALQLWCPSIHGVPPDEYPRAHLWEYSTEDAHSLRRSEVSHAELASFMDSHLTRNGKNTFEVCSHCFVPMGIFSVAACFYYEQVIETRSREPCSDDEVGHIILYEAPDDGCEIHDRAEKIVSTAMRHSHGVLKVEVVSRPPPPPPRALFRSRVYDEMIELWTNHPALHVALTRGSALHTDYVPTIRHIVAGEDLQTLVAGQQQQGSRRTTRSSQGNYIRSIEMSERERVALVNSELGGLLT